MDKEFFFIPRNTFQPGSTMFFRMTVFKADYVAVKNTADLKVVVLSSPLIAEIADGDRLHSLNRGDGSLLLDGSGSYDPDVLDPMTDSAISRTWTCKLLLSDTNCFSDTLNAQVLPPGNTTVTIPASAFYVIEDDDAFMFTITVKKLDRVASSTVAIEVTSDPVPDVYISTSMTEAKHRAQRQLQLIGHIRDAVDGSNYTYQWTCTTGNIDLNDSSKISTSTTSKDLVLKPNVLVAGAYYTFNFEVSLVGFSAAPGRAKVQVLVNEPPSGGYCDSDVQIGIALNTTFTLSCLDWEDVDTPLRYAFVLMQEDGTELDIAVFQGSNRVQATLPAGNHTVSARIEDKLGAVAEYSFTINVTAAQASTDWSAFASAQSETLLGSATTGNQNKFMQVFVGTTATLGAPAVTDLTNATDAEKEMAKARIDARKSLSQAVVAMSEASFLTSESIRQQFELVAEVLKYPSEVDCSFRSTLFDFLEKQVQALYTDDTLEINFKVIMAVLASLGNLMDSISRDLGASFLAVVSNTTGDLKAFDTCATSLADEAADFSVILITAIKELTQKQLETTVPGQEVMFVFVFIFMQSSFQV